MRLGVIHESILEFLALRLGRVPVPAGEALFGMMLSRALMAGVRLGLFDALESGPLTAAELANRVGCDASGVEALAEALNASGYLKRDAGRFANSPRSFRWLVSGSPDYLGNLLQFNYDHWEWWSRLEDCLLRGEPVGIHHEPQREAELRRYVLGMRDLARLSAPEVARRLPLPRGAVRLLDVGGSHGAYSATLCRRHPDLTATVVDLQPVARICGALVAEEGLGERLLCRAGDALHSDLGHDFDVALVFQLLHHFPPDHAVRLLQRVALSLKPDGLVALLEPIRECAPSQMASLLHLHYFLTSGGAVHRSTDIKSWLSKAGFRRARTHRLRTAPGLVLMLAERRP